MLDYLICDNSSKIYRPHGKFGKYQPFAFAFAELCQFYITNEIKKDDGELLYDGDDRYEEVKKLTEDYSMVDIRKQYETALTGTFNNCGGWFPVDNIPDKPCFIPFYRLQVDWNLDIRLCCHDWKEKVVVANLKDDSLHNIWHESFREYREELIKNNRKNISPCNKCNVNGTVNIYTKRESGKQHFNFFKDYYDKF